MSLIMRGMNKNKHEKKKSNMKYEVKSKQNNKMKTRTNWR